MSTVHTEGELRFFVLVKSVVTYVGKALRVFFTQEWNSLYSSTPWKNNEASGSCLLAKEKPNSRLFDSSYGHNYKHIKNCLANGNTKGWDITTLVFAIKHSNALNPDGRRYRKRIVDAIEDLTVVKNFAYSHATKASVSRKKFLRVMEKLYNAAGALVRFSHPLAEQIRQAMTHTEFLTDQLVAYKRQFEDDRERLLFLERDFERFEVRLRHRRCQKKVRAMRKKKALKNKRRQQNGEIISRLHHRVKLVNDSLDQSPSLSSPDILQERRYLTLINKSNALSFNFRWKDLRVFLDEYIVGSADVDIDVFAQIQGANALSLQSKKRESIEMFNQLYSQASKARNGVVILARIMLCKAYILHDLEDDEAAIREATEAEMILSTTECHEDNADINYAIANIILSKGKNSEKDRQDILFRVNKTIELCDKSAVNKNVLKTQATIRKALIHLGYYQHGIKEGVPRAEVNLAKVILDRIADDDEPITKRSQVYYGMCRSLLACRLGDVSSATKLECKTRRKCEEYKLHNELKQLDELKQLIRAL